MSDQDELRDRIAEIIERSLTVWINDLSAGGAEADYAAQAIIDEFGMQVEERIDEPGKRGINPVQRVVGKWEESDEQEPRP